VRKLFHTIHVRWGYDLSQPLATAPVPRLATPKWGIFLAHPRNRPSPSIRSVGQPSFLERTGELRCLFVWPLHPHPPKSGYTASIVRERLDNASKLSPMPCLHCTFAYMRCWVPSQQQVKRVGIVMGTVMIRCPKTGRAISTGIRADVATFHATPVFFSQVLCPLCQLTHEWFAKDAWICDMPGE
jgi:hypothetical protein